MINSASKGNGPNPKHVLCHSAACIHSDGDRVGDSEPEAEGDGVADADSEAEQEHGGEMHACIRRSWGGSCHLEMPKLWVWHHQAGGGGIPEADSDADGVGAVAQSNRMGSSNSQPFGG